MIDEVLFPILYKSIDHLMPSVAGEIWSAGLGGRDGYIAQLNLA